MIKVQVPGEELFDDEKQQFFSLSGYTLELEHSLASLWTWESKWKRPFLGSSEKTTDETYGYLEAMCQTPDVPSEVFRRIPSDEIKRINDYIEDTNTATTFREIPGAKRSHEVVTAEIIYYWMVALNIPFGETEHWHLSRLFTLIKVVNQKNAPAQKMSPTDAAARQREINAQRRAAMGSTG